MLTEGFGDSYDQTIFLILCLFVCLFDRQTDKKKLNYSFGFYNIAPNNIFSCNSPCTDTDQLTKIQCINKINIKLHHLHVNDLHFVMATCNVRVNWFYSLHYYYVSLICLAIQLR